MTHCQHAITLLCTARTCGRLQPSLALCLQVLAVRPLAYGTSQAQRRHEARHLSLCRGGGGLPCGFRRRPSYPVFAPPVRPPLGLARRVLPTGTVMWSVPHPLSAASPPCRFVLGGGVGTVRTSLPSSLTLGGEEVCWWGGSLGVIPSLHTCRRHDASTAQARGAAPVPLQGGGHALWLPSSPFLPCLRTPSGPPAGACTGRALYIRPAPSRRCLPTLPLCPWGGGGAFRPPYLHPPPWGGQRCGGGGALVVVPPQHARRRHDASMAQARGAALVPLQGGGACRMSPVVAPTTLRAHPQGGGGVWGGGGLAPLSSSLPCTHVAGTTQARRKHGVRHSAAAGGGVLFWAFPPFSMV